MVTRQQLEDCKNVPMIRRRQTGILTAQTPWIRNILQVKLLSPSLNTHDLRRAWSNFRWQPEVPARRLHVAGKDPIGHGVRWVLPHASFGYSRA